MNKLNKQIDIDGAEIKVGDTVIYASSSNNLCRYIINSITLETNNYGYSNTVMRGLLVRNLGDKKFTRQNKRKNKGRPLYAGTCYLEESWKHEKIKAILAEDD